MLRCKKGDLAIFVRSDAGNEGAIVQCLEYVGSVAGFFQKDLWRVDRPMRTVFAIAPDIKAAGEAYAPDSYLRPLRGDLTSDTESTEQTKRQHAPIGDGYEVLTTSGKVA